MSNHTQTTTTTNDTATWRDLTDQLTEQQIKVLASIERATHGTRLTSGQSWPEHLLGIAREKVRVSQMNVELADFPLPAGTIEVEEWLADVDGEGPFRYFTGSSWVVLRSDQHEDVSVSIGARGDGDCEQMAEYDRIEVTR